MQVGFFDNLQVKVTLVFLLGALVPLGIISIFSERTADRVIESILTDHLENVATEKQEFLERWIAERKGDLEVVARSAIIGSMDPAQIGPYLELVRSQYGVYNRFVIAGPDGSIVYQSDGAPGGSCNDETWYRQAMAGSSFMSEVTLEADGQESTFLLATPIHDPEKRPAGAVCATVSTRAILARVLNVALGATGECYLVDKTGTFLVHKEPRRILRESIAQSESFARVFAKNRARPIYTDYRGIPVLGASRAVADTQWYLVVEQDRDEAFASSYRLKRNIYVVIGLTVVGAIALSWLLASYVVAPIRRLSEAADALAGGDFENAMLGARTTRRDELGALYGAFKHMAGQLGDRHKKLTKRVGRTRARLRKTGARLQSTLEAAARSEHLASLGRLASGVAHEIRTPLTSLKLYLQSVQDEVAVSEELREDFDVAMRQVLRIEATINHFLDFARPQDPVLSDVDFARLVDDALAVVRPRANQQEVEIETLVAAELPRVRGDVRQLCEALVNLLVNALEAMPTGGRLAITVEPAEGNAAGTGRPGVQIEVSDGGPGIKPEDLDRLFEPFFTTKASGSGLGLAIVYGTVQRHGGTITVRTEPEAGTTFSIRLPATTA